MPKKKRILLSMSGSCSYYCDGDRHTVVPNDGGVELNDGKCFCNKKIGSE